jgi:hypothetical protein
MTDDKQGRAALMGLRIRALEAAPMQRPRRGGRGPDFKQLVEKNHYHQSSIAPPSWLLLRRSLEDFQYDWITLRAKAREAQLSEGQSPRTPVSKLLENLIQFRSQIETHIADETKVWSDEIEKRSTS